MYVNFYVKSDLTEIKVDGNQQNGRWWHVKVCRRYTTKFTTDTYDDGLWIGKGVVSMAYDQRRYVPPFVNTARPQSAEA